MDIFPTLVELGQLLGAGWLLFRRCHAPLKLCKVIHGRLTQTAAYKM